MGAKKKTSVPKKREKKIPCVVYLHLQVPLTQYAEHVEMHEAPDIKKAVALRKLIESDAIHRVTGATISVLVDGEPIEERLFDGAKWIDNPHRKVTSPSPV